MKIYLDQNYLQQLIETVPVNELNKIIIDKKIDLCLGTHNIYEFARCFLKKENAKKGKKIFEYLHKLDIKYFIKLPSILIN